MADFDLTLPVGNLRFLRSGELDQQPSLPNQGFLTPVFRAGPFFRAALLISWFGALCFRAQSMFPGMRPIPRAPAASGIYQFVPREPPEIG